MPARCGPLGPMICLNGATCNGTTGVCVNCPVGYRNDETLFRGNQNCGLNETSIYFVYILTSTLSLIVTIVAFVTTMQRKKSTLRLVFFLVGVWVGLIPFVLLAHYLDGMRFGLASTVIFIIVLVSVNLQVAVWIYMMETFLSVACNYQKIRERQQHILLINGFWLLCKVAFGVIMLVGLATWNDDVFNAGQCAMIFSLVVEVSTNVYRYDRIVQMLQHRLQELKEGLQASSMNPAVRDFADRLSRSRWLMPIYALVFGAVCVALPVLFVIYQSSIPYTIVIFAIIAITWPSIGAAPLFVMRTRLGQQLEKGTGSVSKTHDASGSVIAALSPLAPPNPQSQLQQVQEGKPARGQVEPTPEIENDS